MRISGFDALRFASRSSSGPASAVQRLWRLTALCGRVHFGSRWLVAILIVLTQCRGARAEIQLRTTFEAVRSTMFLESDIAVDWSGRIFVATGGVINTFDRDGNIEGGGGDDGTVTAITIAPDDRLYEIRDRQLIVGDRLNPTFVLTNVRDVVVDAANNFYTVTGDLNNGVIERRDSAGGNLADLGPIDFGLALDPAGNVYGTRQGNVVVRNSTGQQIRSFPSDASASGGIGVDPVNGETLVGGTAGATGAVLRFSTSGALVETVAQRDSVEALHVDFVGNLYTAHSTVINAAGERATIVEVYDRVVRSTELTGLAAPLIRNSTPLEGTTAGRFFSAFAKQASRTDGGLMAIAAAQSGLRSNRQNLFSQDAEDRGMHVPEIDARARTLELIDGLYSQLLLESTESDQAPEEFVLAAGDPFFGRYFSDVTLAAPLPPHVTLTLDPASAVTTISKPQILGGRENPKVLSSTIGVDVVNGTDLRVTDFTFVTESYNIAGHPTGTSSSFLPAGAQTFGRLTSSITFEGHAEGWITNSLYPASRPMLAFVDVQGNLFPRDRRDALVWGTNEPILLPGLPGGPPTLFPGEAFVATRPSFDSTSKRLTFRENTDPAKLPDVSVVFTPTGMFSNGVGTGEALVGANLSIAPLLFEGPDASGHFHFADSTFELRNADGIFARGMLSDILIDPQSFAFTAQVSFDDVAGALSSAFIDHWKADPARLELLSPQGTIALLALTENFAVSNEISTDFIHMTAVPEPATWVLAIFVAVVASLTKHAPRRPVAELTSADYITAK